MRRALLSVAVGLAGAAVLTGAAWSLETAALPPPARADRVAADTARWLSRYRLVVDVFHIAGTRTTGLCLRGAFAFRRSGPQPGSLISLTSGPVLFVTHHHGDKLVAGGRQPSIRTRLAAHVGCSYQLLVQLSNATQANLRLRVERAYAAGQPAIALRMPPIKDERLTLYVSPRTYRPLVAIARIDGRDVTARLFLTRPTPGLLARFRLGPAGKPDLRP